MLKRMAIFFGHRTAEYILNSALASEFLVSGETPASCGFVDDAVLESIDFSEFEIPEGEPLDLMVGSREKRRRRKGISCHASTLDLPHGAYLEISPDVYVASPQLCLLQRAQYLSFAGRVKLAARFCGTYAPSKRDPRGFITRPALASTDGLASFVELCPNIRGKQQVLDALAWTLPNAASPMETEMVMPFYLPWGRGGFGLPKPTMNYEVTLSARGRSMTGARTARIDAFWEDTGFGLEYQSEMFHKGDERYGADIGRQLAIELTGRKLQMVTLAQLANSAQLERLAELIAHYCGVTLDLKRPNAQRAGLVSDILSD